MKYRYFEVSKTIVIPGSDFRAAPDEASPMLVLLCCNPSARSRFFAREISSFRSLSGGEGGVFHGRFRQHTHPKITNNTYHVVRSGAHDRPCSKVHLEMLMSLLLCMV